MGNIDVAPSNLARFLNANDGDLLIYTDSNTQSIHLGGQVGDTAFLSITASNVTSTGGLHMSSGYIVNQALRLQMNSNTPVVVPRVAATGSVGSTVGTNSWTSSNFTFTLSNTQQGFTFTGGVFINSNLQFLNGNSGTSNAPTFAWNSDSNTGIYTPGASQVSFTTAGKLVGTASNNNFLVNTSNIISATNTYGYRNLAINGDMAIDQRNRGANAAVPQSTSVYGVDRFYTYSVNAATQSVGQCNINYAVKGFQYAYRNTVTVGSSTLSAGHYTSIFGHRVEGQFCSYLKWGTSEAQPLTVSFWMFCNVSAPFYLVIRNYNSTRSYVTPINTTANTWERFTRTIQGEPSGTWYTSLTDVGLTIDIFTAIGTTYQTGTSNAWVATNVIGLTGSTAGFIANTNNVALVTGFQVEQGNIATPFEFRSYAQELLMCQRYYYIRYNESVYDRYGFWSPDAATYGFTVFPFPTRMRIVPSFGISSVNDFSFGGGSVSSIGTDVNSTTPELGVIRLEVTGVTPGKVYQVVAANKAIGTAWFSFNSELA